MIPPIPEMRQSVQGLSVEELDQMDEDERHFVICAKRHLMNPDAEVVHNPSLLALRQNPDAAIGLGRILEKIADGLARSQHAHMTHGAAFRLSIASTLLGLSAVLRKNDDDALDSLNRILEAVQTVTVTQFAVLPGCPDGDADYRFGDFVYGLIDLNLLRYRTDKVNSNYFDLYGDHSRGRLSVLRDGRRLKLINPHSIVVKERGEIRGGTLLYRICNEYFRVLAEAEMRNFWLDLDRSQAIFGAAGVGTISSDFMKKAHGLTHRITVFTPTEKRFGWVMPFHGNFEVRTTEPEALASGTASVKSGLQLEDWPKRPLDPFIQTYAGYIERSRELEADECVEEALTHLIFALDHLLGGKSGDSLTSDLAERIAVLTYVGLDEPYGVLSKYARDVYNMRSRYVHRGERGRLGSEKGPNSLGDRLAKLKRIARVILGTSCFARLQSWTQNEEPRDAWIDRIDLIRNRIRINPLLDRTDADIKSWGLDRVKLDDKGLAYILDD
jgi:hypothetical protein